MSKKMLKKHWGIFISTTVFMVFFIGYLFLNYILQGQSVKAATYSSYVTQLSFQAASLSSDSPIGIKNHIKSGLDTLETGGRAKIAANTVVKLPPLDQFLVSVEHNLSAIKSNLDNGDFAAVDLGLTELTEQVEKEVVRKTKLVNILQVIVGIFTLFLYLMITLQLIKRLSHSEEIEDKTKQESEGILNTVSEGLFLLSRDYEIGVEQSASLKGMFKRDMDLEGNFFDFVSQYITESDMGVAKDYVELLFGDRVKEKLVESLNPLNNVEINIARRDGSFENRYLDFRFKRVFEDGQLKHLLGSVTDVTKQVLLEKELADSKEKQEAQIDLLKSILHIDNAQLKIFFNATAQSLDTINKTLEAHDKPSGQGEISNMLVGISQHVHKIKGDAAALGLHQFEFSSHEFETTIDSVRSTNKNLSGKNLLPLTISLRGMFKDLDDMQTLVNKFSESFSTLPKSSSTEKFKDNHSDNFLSKIQKLVDSVSERTKTRVNLSFLGFESTVIPSDIEQDLNNVIVQLVRNAIVHGNESPEQRLQRNKPYFMSLVISLTKTARGHELIVRDDGKGIDEQAVFTKAVQLGLAKKENDKKISLSHCLKYIFHPRFSTENNITLDSGRGIGLPLVRNILLNKKGKLAVKSEKGVFCQFHLVFPFLEEPLSDDTKNTEEDEYAFKDNRVVDANVKEVLA